MAFNQQSQEIPDCSSRVSLVVPGVLFCEGVLPTFRNTPVVPTALGKRIGSIPCNAEVSSPLHAVTALSTHLTHFFPSYSRANFQLRRSFPAGCVS